MTHRVTRSPLAVVTIPGNECLDTQYDDTYIQFMSTDLLDEMKVERPSLMFKKVNDELIVEADVLFSKG